MYLIVPFYTGLRKWLCTCIPTNVRNCLRKGFRKGPRTGQNVARASPNDFAQVFVKVIAKGYRTEMYRVGSDTSSY